MRQRIAKVLSIVLVLALTTNTLAYGADLEVAASENEAVVASENEVAATSMTSENEAITVAVASENEAVASENEVATGSEEAAGNDGLPAPKLYATLSINSTKLSLTPADDYQLSADIVKTNIRISADDIEWYSSNESVATVSKGYIQAINPGETVISVSLGECDILSSNECLVTVNQGKKETISLSKRLLRISACSESRIVATIYPNTRFNDKIYWTTADGSIATVSSDGTVKGFNAGTTIIKATLASDSSVTASCKVIVTKDKKTQAKALYVKSRNIKLAKGSTFDLVPQFKAKGSNTKQPGVFEWTSNNSSIVAIDATGKLTGIGVGTAKVYGMYGGLVIPITVKVTNPITDITLDSQSVSLNAGQSIRLTAIFAPSDTTDNRNITWKIVKGGNKTAKVNSRGLVTGIQQGETTVQAIAKSSTVSVGRIVKECKVTVSGSKVRAARIPVDSINITGDTLNLLSNNEIELGIGAVDTLETLMLPLNTTDSSISFKSSNSKYVKVDRFGTLVAVRATKSPVKITVKCKNKTASINVTVSGLYRTVSSNTESTSNNRNLLNPTTEQILIKLDKLITKISSSSNQIAYRYESGNYIVIDYRGVNNGKDVETRFSISGNIITTAFSSASENSTDSIYYLLSSIIIEEAISEIHGENYGEAISLMLISILTPSAIMTYTLSSDGYQVIADEKSNTTVIKLDITKHIDIQRSYQFTTDKIKEWFSDVFNNSYSAAAFRSNGVILGAKMNKNKQVIVIGEEGGFSSASYSATLTMLEAYFGDIRAAEYFSTKCTDLNEIPAIKGLTIQENNYNEPCLKYVCKGLKGIDKASISFISITIDKTAYKNQFKTIIEPEYSIINSIESIK